MFETQNEKSRHDIPARRWSVGGVLGSMGRNVLLGLQRWQRGRAVFQLRNMDDRMLEDIGISRNEISQVVDSMVALPGDCVTPAGSRHVGSEDEVSQLREAA